MRLSEILSKPFWVIIAILGIVVGGFGIDLMMFRNGPLHVNEEKVFTISAGSSLGQVAYALAAQGMIDNPRYFSLWGRLRGVAARIHVGEYHIRPGMTPVELLDDMANGRVVQYSLTLVEGWTFRQMLDVIHSHEKLEHTLAGKDFAGIMTAIGAEGQHPEGRFFPDTYHFPAGTKDVDFLKRAYDAMSAALANEWERRTGGLPYKEPYEALIMASIVEKETAVPSEREAIAGVFVRRLQKKMRLQTDPTVIYGMGEAYDGNIRKHDLKRDTPYNTYTRRGLPPTPIAMPSLESVHAALHPAEGESLYFVAKGEGSHYFSATLEEHLNAVKKYQLKRK